MAGVNIDVRGVQELSASLRALGDEAPKAVFRAIRRTRTSMMAQLARVVAQSAGLPVRRVKKSLHGFQPNISRPEVRMILWGGRAPLIDYSTGVARAALPKSGFRARMPAGHVGYFERRPGQASLESVRGRSPGKAVSRRIRPGIWHTLPIDEAYGPDFTKFASAGAIDELLRFGGETFTKNLAQEINFRVGRQQAAAYSSGLSG